MVYPEALTHMPGAPFWSILFFLMLISLGFSSEVGITVADIYVPSLPQRLEFSSWFVIQTLTILLNVLQFSMVECFISGLADEFPGVLRRSRRGNLTFRLITITCFFLLTLPMVTEVSEQPHQAHNVLY